MRYDKNIKRKKNQKTFIFVDEKYFSTDFEKSKISKSHIFRKFLKKVNIFKKSTFSKTSKFSKFSKKSTFFEKSDFWNFRFFKIFRKIFFIEKIKVFGKFSLFIFFIVSHGLPQQVASRNSHCAACGRDKRPGRKPENPENSKFWRFLGALFPYKSYRIFIKICDSKKFKRFFIC